MAKPFLERARKMISGEMPRPPIAQTIGFVMIDAGPGYALFELETDVERHANPMGTVHGGVLCDVSDSAMGMAWASELEEGETFTTLELKINFLKPVWNGKLRAEGRVVKRGKTVGLVECDVRNADGDLVARATSTIMTLRGDKAQGR
jgi:uncharacterized protein (TIGR00369 family)